MIWQDFSQNERKSRVILKKFSKIAHGFEKNGYLCSDLEEKYRVADALAFISHFTEVA